MLLNRAMHGIPLQGRATVTSVRTRWVTDITLQEYRQELVAEPHCQNSRDIYRKFCMVELGPQYLDIVADFSAY